MRAMDISSAKAPPLAVSRDEIELSAHSSVGIIMCNSFLKVILTI